MKNAYCELSVMKDAYCEFRVNRIPPEANMTCVRYSRVSYVPPDLTHPTNQGSVSLKDLDHWPLWDSKGRFFFFCILVITFALVFSLPPIMVVTQIPGHIAGLSPPSPARLKHDNDYTPTTLRAFHFIARRPQPFLPSTTPVEWAE